MCADNFLGLATVIQLLGPSSLAGSGGNLTVEAGSAGMDSLAVILLSACSKRRGTSSLVLGGDSLIGSVGHSEPASFDLPSI